MMTTTSFLNLIINNSTCSITGLSIEQHKALRDILSYEENPQAAYYSENFRSSKRYLMDKKGVFPTGLLYLVQDYLKTHKLIGTVFDCRFLPEPMPDDFHFDLEFSLLAPYPEQMAAAQACQMHGRGIICAPTGVGKSMIAALIIERIKVPTLVVVPSLELKKQLTQSLSKAFGASKVGSAHEKKLIAVENVDALDPEQVLDLYDCVIIDEFHHSGATTYRKLNKKAWSGVYYKFGLTATPFRSKDEERLLLESVLSQVIYQIAYQKAVKKGYIAPLEAYYYEIPKQKVKGYRWAEVYSELVVNNQPRNQLIANLLEDLNAAGASTLCLVKEIKHGENIQKLLTFDCAFVKGENDNNRMLIVEFLLRQRQCLIGTTGVLGEGVDTKPAEYVIIAGLGKSKNQFMQQSGRSFRVSPGKESAKLILILDRSHRWSISHFKAQCKYLLEEYGITPTKLKR